MAVAEQRASELEAALETAGALAVSLADAEADTESEQAILEPAAGATPLWSRIEASALFAADADRTRLLLHLSAILEWLDPRQCQFRLVEDQDWERVWMDRFQPMRFGERLWIYPWNIEPPADDSVVVRLDPGLAFGTGTHPTTALCLEWLDSTDVGSCRVIDYGCGSGVLGIAACKLSAAEVIGIDNDPQALTASADNAERNGVAQRCRFVLPDAASLDGLTAPVLLANILAGPLFDLAPRLAGMLEPGGALVLSGILDGQQDELLTRYQPWFDQLTTQIRDGWIRITGTRRPI